MKLFHHLTPLSTATLIACCLFVPFISASAYDFESGIGPGWIPGGRVHWHLDDMEIHGGDYSLRSGEIDCTGTSSLSREVQGPVEIRFWWKKDPVSGSAGRATEFTFSVDENVQRVCSSSEWVKESYSLDNGTHWIEWDFRKMNCYPRSQGVGWIDDVEITSELVVPEVVAPELVVPSEILPYINESISSLSENVSWLKEDISDVKYDVSELRGNVSGINCSMSVLEGNVSELERHIGVPLRYEDVVSYVERDISDVRANVIPPYNDVVYVDPNMDDLQNVIDNSENKTIYLKNGRHHGPVDITSKNISIKSVNRYEAIIDGDIKLDNTSKVSIEGITIRNSGCGIFIGSSKDCKIEDNQITSSDNELGICVGNCSRILIGYNNIDIDGPNTSIGIRLDDSSCVYIYHNNINADGFSIYLNESFGNTIYNKLDGNIHENGKEYAYVNNTCYYHSEHPETCYYHPEHVENPLVWDVIEEYTRVTSNIWVCCE